MYIEFEYVPTYLLPTIYEVEYSIFPGNFPNGNHATSRW